MFIFILGSFCWIIWGDMRVCYIGYYYSLDLENNGMLVEARNLFLIFIRHWTASISSSSTVVTSNFLFNSCLLGPSNVSSSLAKCVVDECIVDSFLKAEEVGLASTNFESYKLKSPETRNCFFWKTHFLTSLEAKDIGDS
jgi:hypothetical protein